MSHLKAVFWRRLQKPIDNISKPGTHGHDVLKFHLQSPLSCTKIFIKSLLFTSADMKVFTLSYRGYKPEESTKEDVQTAYTAWYHPVHRGPSEVLLGSETALAPCSHTVEQIITHKLNNGRSKMTTLPSKM